MILSSPVLCRRQYCLLLLSLLFPGFAAAQVNITKLPYTITKPGRYQLYTSLTYNGIGNAITINASDVTLDLRGKVITGNRTVAMTNETAAIFATGRSNLTIQNGTIKNFFRGVYIEGNPDTQEGHLVQGIKVSDGTFLGIQVKGRNSIIQNNTVSRIALDGGTTTYTAMRYGMDLMGEALHVVGNRIIDVQINSTNPTGNAWGIYVHEASGSIIEKNKVSNTSASLVSLSVNQAKIAIVVKDSTSMIAEENHCTGFQFGMVFENCGDGVYRRNIVNGNTSTAYVVLGAAVTDGGNNN